MPRAVEGDHNTRLTLAVRPNRPGNDCTAIGIEHSRSDLSAAAKGRLSAALRCYQRREIQTPLGLMRDLSLNRDPIAVRGGKSPCP